MNQKPDIAPERANVFTDLHIPTGPTTFQSNTTTFSSQGNPLLVPEVSRTYTVGAVWTPDFIQGLTVGPLARRVCGKSVYEQVLHSQTTVPFVPTQGPTPG